MKNVSECTEIMSNFLLEEFIAISLASKKKKPAAQNLFLSKHIVDLEKTKTLENQFLNLAHFL
jgi:hypothetical protein